MIRFVGDIHAKFRQYGNVVHKVDHSIQVGDFGIGFDAGRDAAATEFQTNNPNHRFIRGNHDNPAKCREMPNYIPDGQIEDDIMFVGGAWSIDHAYRTPGIDWWPDEEISHSELYALVLKYEQVKPRIMVTHDLPSTVAKELFFNPKGNIDLKKQFPSRTGAALDAMFDVHKPDLWIFGHWHFDVDTVYKDTRFICLNALSYIDIDLNSVYDGHIVEYSDTRIIG